MKIILSFFSLLLALTSASQKREVAVKVIAATSQHWVSGAPGGRTGTKYAIKVYINTDKKIAFQNIWIGEENVAFDVEFFSLDIPKKIQFGDTLLLTYNKVNGERNENEDGKRLPIDYKGVALIELTIDGMARYLTVKCFTQLPALKGN